MNNYDSFFVFAVVISTKNSEKRNNDIDDKRETIT